MSKLRQYETIYILAPNTSTEDKTRVEERVEAVFEKTEGAEQLRVDDWGVRPFAYPIGTFDRGTYIYIRHAAPADMIAELERALRLLDPVIRFLTIKLEADAPIDPPPTADEVAAAAIKG